MKFYNILPDSTRPLFDRLSDVLSKEIQLERTWFSLSAKYGNANANDVVSRHRQLILDGTDALVPMRPLNKGVCIETDDKMLKFTSASALSRKKFIPHRLVVGACSGLTSCGILI